MSRKLSLPQARRIALQAQGLAKVRSTEPVTARAVDRAFSRLQLVQIDSVNVVARSHLLPFFSRLGNYDTTILASMAQAAPRKMMEYWAHEASFIRPVHFHDLRVWQNRTWMGAAGVEPKLRETLENRIMALLESHHFLTAREMKTLVGHEEINPREAWGWNWSAVKRVLEGLFERGLVSAAGRNGQFERQYALTAAVLPAAVSRTVDVEPDKSQAMLRLIAAAAQAHGLGTVRCFADYFRLPLRESAAAVETLERQGVLLPVSVEGWDGRIFLHHEAPLPRKAQARALLSPFDSLVFERGRLERLHNFHYRLEIYTPEPKRRHGYYVLPFLLGENMVARVDLKADRQSRTLLVRGAYAEANAPAQAAEGLAAELQLMAQWLGLADVQVQAKGDLAPALRLALD